MTEKALVSGKDFPLERDEEMGSDAIKMTDPAKPMHPLLWNLMLVVGTFIYSSYTILVHLCEVDGKMPFSSASTVLMTEITKITLSMGMYYPEVRERGNCGCPSLKNALPFAVPALLYAINNNLAVYIQLQMDPATYQVLGNLKILSTAFLFRLIIKRPISRIQWCALSLLVMAGICNSYGGLQAKSASGSKATASTLHITVLGLGMISVYCTISGLAGVYTEYVLKKQPQMSIHLQNGLLYLFGITINGGAFMVQASSFKDSSEGFNLFRGYSFYTVLLIITQAFGGIIMGAIMKHASNITRLFLISCAMVVTTVASMLIFGLVINIYFCSSFVLVVGALYLYHQ